MHFSSSRLIFALLPLLFFITACSDKNKEPVTLAINPWPGYELLYLAEQKGFFEQLDLNLKLVQLGSLSDAQRSYLHNHTDGMTSTLIEAIQAQVMGNEPLKIIMVPDYSNGGDVIITSKGISSVEQLKGKRIGCEVSSLGLFILQRALQKSGLTLNDVTIVNTEQSDGKRALNNQKIDAFISYPPVSINILNNDQYHAIFSSADIPNEIIDVVSFSEQTLIDNPDLFPKLHQAWDMAPQYYQDNTKQAASIMAKREHISTEDFIHIINSDLILLNSDEQQAMLKPQGELNDTIRSVCKTLVHSNAININCNDLENIIFDTSSQQ